MQSYRSVIMEFRQLTPQDPAAAPIRVEHSDDAIWTIQHQPVSRSNEVPLQEWHQ